MAVRVEKESSSGKGSSSPGLATVSGTLPFESQIMACLFFTSFQFHHSSVSLKLFEAFSVLALADCSACIHINQIEFTYNVSFLIPLKRVSGAGQKKWHNFCGFVHLFCFPSQRSDFFFFNTFCFCRLPLEQFSVPKQ